MHNDPYIALVEVLPRTAAMVATGIPGLVVRLFLCLYLYPSLSVPLSTVILLLSERVSHAQELHILVSRDGLAQ
jgi:hypothetical protein